MTSVLLFLLTIVSLDESRLLIVGDSLTAGYGVRSSEAYPSLMEAELRKSLPQLKIYNGGVSGDTTAGGLRRLPWMLREARPDFVVIALGGNDMLRGLPVEITKENLRKMVAMSLEKKLPTFVLGVPALGNLGRSYEVSFNQMYLDVGKEFKVPVLQNLLGEVAGQFKYNLPDGIHPSPEGHRILAARISDFLKPYLEKSNATHSD